MMKCRRLVVAGLAPALAVLAPLARAQTPPPAAASAPAAAASAPASAPTPAPAPPPTGATARPRTAGDPPASAAGAGAAQRVEITGGRVGDTDQRRQATAAKIVVGRDEIDKFGDATLGEVLRRLPGVTTPGAPGRGGPPRMRGLGGGFTQLLIDGQRVPPGFSLESLTPEQVERIEILRAPTAETGARAIAGTINIITREGFKARLNDLRIGMGVENGRAQGGLNWAHNDSAGPLTYTLNAGVFRRASRDESHSATAVEDAITGEPLEARTGRQTVDATRVGLSLGGRLQWRLNEMGDSLALMPSLFHTEADSHGRFSLVQTLRRPVTPVLYDEGLTDGDSRFTNGRLGLMWRQRVGDVRVEANGHAGAFRAFNGSTRREFTAGAADPLRTLYDAARVDERSLNLTLKASGLAGGLGADGMPNGRPEHSLVAGAEIEAVTREETRQGAPELAEFGDDLKARTLRLAAYAQDEWQLNPNWALHAGLRWEGIATRGDSGTGEQPDNRSSVWTPLVHAVWRPDPKSRDQVRISLTRSYRSPPLGSLIARPTINRDYPVAGPNVATAPDTAGNPDLRPELATGVDIALEHYLEGGGVLSMNLFHRRITDLMRGVVDLETVSWSPVQRHVRRQRNIGNATTSGVELEAKFRLDQLVAEAPRVELRANLALYRSRVAAVPGPDNRLDQQSPATGNLGADWRLRGTPLTIGGNVNWVPSYTTRVDDAQTLTVSTKRVVDVYALWTFSPTVGLRVLANNLAPRDYDAARVDTAVNPFTGRLERVSGSTVNTGATNVQVRLELKL